MVWEREENYKEETRNGKACEFGKAEGLVEMNFKAGAQKCYVTSLWIIQPRKRPLTQWRLSVEGRMAAQVGQAVISWRGGFDCGTSGGTLPGQDSAC